MTKSLLVQRTNLSCRLTDTGLGKFGGGTGTYTPISSSVPLENAILKKAVKELKKYLKKQKIPYQVIKLHGDAYQPAGLPDLLIVLPEGKTIWIEFKRPGADTTALQRHNLRLLDGMGHYAGTCDSEDLLIRIVKKVLKKGE